MAIGAIEPQFYSELLTKAGIEDLAQGQMDPANWPAYTQKLASLFKTKTQAQWEEILGGSDACFAPVLDLDEARDHPHMKAREAILKVFSPLLGTDVPMQGVVPKLDLTPGAINSAGPALGQDTGAILDVLGYSPYDQAALREQNVI